MSCKFLANYGFDFSSYVQADTSSQIASLTKDHASLETKYNALAHSQATENA